MVESLKVRLGLGSHASLAVGVVKLGLAGHSIVLGPGNVLISGAWVSCTVMVWLAVLLLWQASVAVQVRVTE